MISLPGLSLLSNVFVTLQEAFSFLYEVVCSILAFRILSPLLLGCLCISTISGLHFSGSA